MYVIICSSFFVYGLCFGSFFNVLVYRIPLLLKGNKITTFNESSKCPKCNTKIKFYFNIPVLGWLILRGKCYDCKNPISVLYPFYELLWGIIFLINYILTTNLFIAITLCLLEYLFTVCLVILKKLKK